MSAMFVTAQIILLITAALVQTSTTQKLYKLVQSTSPEEQQGLLLRNLRSYEIDHPVITDGARSHLGYLTDHLSRRRRKRAINVVGEHEPFHYKFHANGEDYHMELKMNTELFGPNFKVEHFYEDDKVETNKMQEHCYLVGKTLPQNYSVAISDCDGLFGVVTTDEDMIFIEPLVNDSYVDKDKLTGPGRPHLIYKQSELSKRDQHFNNMGITITAPTRPRRSKRSVHTYVKFINRSGRLVKLMLGTKEHDVLVPNAHKIVRTSPPDKWFARDALTNTALRIGYYKEYVPRKATGYSRKNVDITVPYGVRLSAMSQDDIRKAIGPKYLESMVVADKSVVDFHGKNKAASYIMALMNVVAPLFRHKSLGIELHYVLLRIVLLHKEPSEVKLDKDDHVESLLSACRYMHKIRKGHSDADPYYHDHATYLTRKEFGLAAGYAPVSGICHPTRSCAMNKEFGFFGVFIIAHEIGHSLGMHRDGEDNDCAAANALGSVMSRPVTATWKKYFWSRCSRKTFLDNYRKYKCLNDKPGDAFKKYLPRVHRYPGSAYTVDDQCRFSFGKEYTFCKAFPTKPCEALYCNELPPYDGSCKSNRDAALDGTECGEKKWCMKGSCVPNVPSAQPRVVPSVARNLIASIHGGWSDWQSWQPCTKQCGVGMRIRRRHCDNPKPQFGGRNCTGPATEKAVCNTKRCQHTIPLREEEIKKQCPQLGRKEKVHRPWVHYDERKVDLNCTFEQSLCSWKNVRSVDKHDWRFKRGPTQTKGTGPSVDHTKKTRRGQYIFFESSNPVRRGDTARLSSPDMAVRRGCLTFWYHMYGSGSMGTLRVLKKNKNDEKGLWSRKRNAGDRWVEANVDIKEKASNVYKLLFEVTRGYSSQSDIALDDISFAVGPCRKDDSDEKGSVNNPCLVTCITGGNSRRILPNKPVIDGLRCYDNGSLDICIDGKCTNVGCDGVMGSEKEYDNCGVCGGDGKSCKRHVGKFTRTSQKALESFLYIPEGSTNIKVKKRPNSNYRLVLTVKNLKRSRREISVINGGGRRSSPGIYYSAGTQYVYEVKNGKEIVRSLGRARQHVYIKAQRIRRQTPSVLSINYEYYNKDSDYSWSQGPWSACSKTCSVGSTHRAVTCREKPGNKMVAEKFCKGKKPIVVQTCLVKQCPPVWKTGDWSKCSTTCGVGTQTRHVYCTNGKQRTNGCDSRKKPVARKYCRKPPCPKTTGAVSLDCDFENDLCRWQQRTGDDQFDWMRNNGATPSYLTGPDVDHTLKNQKGHYLYVEASAPRRSLDKAMLVSPVIPGGRACLKFYYHMKGKNVGKLKVKLFSNNAYEKGYLWRRRGTQGNKWNEAKISISMNRPYQIVITGIIGNSWLGDIAIDDITFSKRSCA